MRKKQNFNVSKDVVIRLFTGGFEIKKIADFLDCDRSTIYSKLYENGYSTRGISSANKNRKLKRKLRIKKGYITLRLPWHLDADQDGYVKEHRIIMEWHLGRMLKKDEYVHHINEDKLDNRIENLVLVSKSDHMKIHMARRNEAWKKYKNCCLGK